MVDDNEEMKKRVSEVILHTIVALIKAGPGTTHCELIDKFQSSDVEEYAKVYA